MNAQIAVYENRLRSGAHLLEEMETSGGTDLRYERTLRQWLELLAAYEYECEISEASMRLLAEAV